MANRWHVYKIEVNGVLIYIGTTCDVAKRRGDHSAKRYLPRFASSVSIVRSFASREKAFAAETKAIRKHRPVGNFRSNPNYKTVKERDLAVYQKLTELEAAWWRQKYGDVDVDAAI